jgi:hypothetical protein
MNTSNDQPSLTANEIRALKLILNYSDRVSQHSDNFSNAGMDELTSEMGWNKHQVAALMGSLESKGMGSYEKNDDLFWLTHHAINTIFDIIDAEALQAA